MREAEEPARSIRKASSSFARSLRNVTGLPSTKKSKEPKVLAYIFSFFSEDCRGFLREESSFSTSSAVTGFRI